MSLSGAISAAVTALSAQSSALSLVSNNLANASTTAYKTTSASFASLLSGGSAVSGVASGGVAISGVSNVTEQGLLTSSSVSTNVAIYGNGFFVTNDAAEGGAAYYTRNGEFSVDADGYLVNNGYFLQGWPTDADGTVVGGTTASNLESIDVDSISTIASPTTETSFVANLPADATVGGTFTSSIEVFDSLGTAANVTVTWTKTADNSWTASFSNPVSNGATIGTTSAGAIAIAFNDDGTLASTSPSPATLAISGWTTGAAASSIALDFGTAGTATGLSQYATGDETLTVDLESTQDGTAMGSLISISIDEDGNVNANYDNDTERAIFKIPVATFTNSDGLTSLSYGMYAASTESGSSTLRLSGQNGAGTVYGSQIELSTTDTSTEFANMMAAQQAYSGAAQVMSAANSMFETLISAVR
ncbi:MAG: flagellar hook protein FlgE [Alphaproteobacteria bacterium]|nr:flagellar hook protein FlgE [Alphaproteobacteria bacterium]